MGVAGSMWTSFGCNSRFFFGFRELRRERGVAGVCL